MPLSDQEHEILKKKFAKRIDSIRIGPGRYLVSSKQYVGSIVLTDHALVIKPKITNLNFFRMLFFTEGLLPEFYKQQSEYEKEIEIYEIIIKRYLDEVENLIRRGVSKEYVEIEANLPAVKQRVLIAETVRRNYASKNTIFCRFSDFTSDAVENQVIKYTLYLLSNMNFEDRSLTRHARRLLRYLDNVTLSPFSRGNFPSVQYNRLNEHYRTIVTLSRLVIDHSSLNLGTAGDVTFSSFLVDMNKLFQQFLFSYLRQSLRGYSVKGEPEYAFDEEHKRWMRPDIVIRRSGTDLLVLDAKYKRNVDEEEAWKAIVPSDYHQIHTYSVRLGLPYGVLVYPKHELSEKYEESYVLGRVTLLTKAIDLSKRGTDFTAECDRFVDDISALIENHVLSKIATPHTIR